jgi:hypothetical protein
MAVFNEASKKPYSQQCVFFLNAVSLLWRFALIWLNNIFSKKKK